MANTGHKGFFARQTGNRLLFDAVLYDSSGAVVTSGTTTLRMSEVQSDGTVKTYDWTTNTFKTSSMSNGGQSTTMSNQSWLDYSAGDASLATGLWTAVLTTLTGFTIGAVYYVRVKNTGASPVEQYYKFSYGGAEGDLVVEQVSTGTANLDVQTIKIGPNGSGTAQTARDIGASVLLSAGTGTGQLDFSSGIAKSNLQQVLGTTLTETVAGQTAMALTSLVSAWGTAGGGGANTLTLATTAVANQFQRNAITIVSGTGAKQTMNITSNTTTTVTVDQNWVVQPDNTSKYVIWASDNPAGDANGAVPIQAGTGQGQVVLSSGQVTVGTYTGNTPQTGDAYALTNSRLPGALTSNGNMKSSILEFLTTALTETTTGWITAAFKKFFNIGSPTSTMNEITVVDTLSNAPSDSSGTTTLLSRLTSARAGYLDNLNVGGAVASHADVAAINTSSSRAMTLTTVGQYAPSESYTIEMRTWNVETGAAVDPDSTPTLAVTGSSSGDLSSHLTSSTPTHVTTGLYRWTYNVQSSPVLEQIRFDGSETTNSLTYTLSAYCQTVDAPTAIFTATDKSNLTAIYNKLPANNIADATVLGSPAGASIAADIASVSAKADTAISQTTGSAIRGDVGLGAANLDTQLNAIYGVAGDVQSQTDKLDFDVSGYVKSDPQTLANAGDLNSTQKASITSAVPTAAAIATATAADILVSPSYKIVTNSDGSVNSEATVDVDAIAAQIVADLTASGVTVNDTSTAAIATALSNALAATKSITVQSPSVNGTNVRINAGDDYLITDGRQLTFTLSGTYPDFTGASVAMKTTTTSYAGTVQTATGSTRVLYVELTSAQTSAMSSDSMRLIVTGANGSVMTEIAGSITVTPKIS